MIAFGLPSFTFSILLYTFHTHPTTHLLKQISNAPQFRLFLLLFVCLRISAGCPESPLLIQSVCKEMQLNSGSGCLTHIPIPLPKVQDEKLENTIVQTEPKSLRLIA